MLLSCENRVFHLAARSAPLMRGLKLGDRGGSVGSRLSSRAVCPANEGIETAQERFRAALQLSSSRAVCPANEGIETFLVQSECCVKSCLGAARSAPLMRGLKQG